MNKGRDYYRALQAHCKQLRNRRRYPKPVGSGDVVEMSDGRRYRRDNIKNKVWTHPYALDVEGKPITIPYQTCTLVRVQVKPQE